MTIQEANQLPTAKEVRDTIIKRLRFIRQYTQPSNREREFSTSGTYSAAFLEKRKQYRAEEAALVAALNATRD